ncbi:MAG: sporulation protein YunB [Clostridia bacterium]|nr:sporulation protein YunB [Clostridia bacterium]
MIKFYYKPMKKRPPPVKAKWLVFKGKKQKIQFRTACAILLICIAIIFGEFQLRPIIKNAGANALKNELTLLLNDAINKTLQSEKIVYNDFITISYNDSGKITAIITDTVFINDFKAMLSEKAAKTVGDCGDFNILVPWGTLFGSEIFSDRGLELIVESSTYGFAVTDIYSSFESVGVNQTLHKIYVEVILSATAYIGNYKVEQTVNSRVPVAETVIIGDVPNAYYDIKK